VALFDLPLAELRSYRPERTEPDDFDAFWRATLSAAAEHDLSSPRTTRYSPR
jgi:cephalosporin-C deacetylase